MTNKEREVSRKTMAIKSRVYNQVARYFNRKDDFFKLSEKEKIEAIELIVKAGFYELRDYKNKRRTKAERDIKRIERGWKPKKKTSKEEYEKQSQLKQAV